MLSFTPQAAKRLRELIQEKGGQLSLSIRIDHGVAGPGWRLTLEHRLPTDIEVSGVPVRADSAVWKQLDSLIIDWVMTPDGPGLGVYDRNLLD